MNWIGRTSPDDVTVERSSGLCLDLNDGHLGRVLARRENADDERSQQMTPIDAPIIIFFLRLNAIFRLPL